MNLTEEISRFSSHLVDEEKSAATREKYLRDVRAFACFLGSGELDKISVIEYKRHITDSYAPSSVNSMLVALNSFLKFIGRGECCVKLLRLQRRIFAREQRELSTAEYKRLLAVSGSPGGRLTLVLRTICETGIRVSELEYITAEAVRAGRAVVECKGKTRVIFIPSSLRRALLAQMKKADITVGCVFVTGGGRPLDRSNIWREMKALCEKARVSREKVFPHNLRHLFARTFYAVERDIVKLADVLGHSSINTTRIYTMETGKSHILCLERVCKRLTT